MTKTTALQPDEITEAKAAVVEAAAQVADISERLLDGNPSVSTSDLVAAEDELEKRQSLFSRAVELRQRREARAADQARQARITDLQRLIRERFGEHEGSIVAAFDSAVAALAPLVTAIAEHNAGLAQIVDELLALGDLPGGLKANRDTGLHLSGADVFVQPIDAGQILAEAAWRALHAAGITPYDAKLELTAGIRYDPHASATLGIPARPDGAPSPHGPSDRLRRTARLVAGRT